MRLCVRLAAGAEAGCGAIASSLKRLGYRKGNEGSGPDLGLVVGQNDLW